MTRYGEEQRLLAQGDPLVPRENATQPAWAPDGLSMLFRANRPPFSDTDIWEWTPEGGDQRLVAHLPGEQLYPELLAGQEPDRLHVTRRRRPRIFTAAADGSDVRTVFNAPGVDDSAPNWSPDGRIAFESAIDGDGEIYVIDADGGNLRQLTHNDVHDEGPELVPGRAADRVHERPGQPGGRHLGDERRRLRPDPDHRQPGTRRVTRLAAGPARGRLRGRAATPSTPVPALTASRSQART